MANRESSAVVTVAARESSPDDVYRQLRYRRHALRHSDSRMLRALMSEYSGSADDHEPDHGSDATRAA